MKLRKNYDILKRISHFVYELVRNKGDKHDIEILPQYTATVPMCNFAKTADVATYIST